MTTLLEVRAAEARIAAQLEETPSLRSPELEEELGAEVFLKCENLQRTGSFKVRGALNKVEVLKETGELPPIVAASTGNHGAAVAFAARSAGATATVFVPTNASPRKLELIRELGARIETHGSDGAQTERHARAWAERHGALYVSPYNDADIIAGQGTVALEILRQAPPLDAIFVALGGGGLLSGIALVMRELSPQTRLFGCSPEPSAVMIRSIAAGEILDIPSGPTLSDGTAGGVEAGAITFPLLREHVSDYVMVPETRTRRALRDFMRTHEMRIEGAAAMTLAACRMQAREFSGGAVAVVLCGANVDDETLEEVRKGAT